MGAYTHRTLVRYGVTIVTLIFFLYYLSGVQGQSYLFIDWIIQHINYISLYLFLAISCGLLAHYLVAYQWTIRFTQVIKERFNISDSKLFALFYKWASCSRCVSWWSGFIIGGVSSLLYWSGILSIKAVICLYFAVLSASIASFTAVLAYIISYIKENNDEE